MSSFFNMDSPIMRFLGRLADVMILNIIFLITCIPIVTIGAAWTSLSYVTLKMARDEESYIVRSYFKSFKQNFRQATVIWLVALAAILVFAADFQIIRNMEGNMQQVMCILLSAVAILFSITLCFVFPVLSKFENSIKNTVKNALLIAISNLPYTLLIMVIIGGCAVVTFLSTQTLIYGLLVWIMMGFALVAFINARFFAKIFDKYIPEETAQECAEEADTSVFQNLHPTESGKKEA